MKYIAIFFLLILMSPPAWAQDADLPERDISLVVLDKKGRPINKILVYSLSNSSAGVTDRKGAFIFTGMTDDDRISLNLPKYGEIVIPVAGMDSIVVTLRQVRRSSYNVNYGGEDVIITKQNKTEPVTTIDVQALVQQNAYKSVLDLLQGLVPGLNISQSGGPGGTARTTNRGINSTSLSSEPLVVIDGIAMSGSIGEINSIVNVYDVKTIEVKKSAPEWGSRGANGVILINTR